jgi:hypothetical protein
VVVLGDVGMNFGAGMTGGEAYIINGYTAEERGQLNTDYVRVVPLKEAERKEGGDVHALIAEHFKWTGSRMAETVLRYWEFYARFRLDKVVSIVERAEVPEDSRGPDRYEASLRGALLFRYGRLFFEEGFEDEGEDELEPVPRVLGVLLVQLF